MKPKEPTGSFHSLECFYVNKVGLIFGMTPFRVRPSCPPKIGWHEESRDASWLEPHPDAMEILPWCEIMLQILAFFPILRHTGPQDKLSVQLSFLSFISCPGPRLPREAEDKLLNVLH